MDSMNRTRITRLAFVIVVVSFLLSTFVSLLSLHLMSRRNQQELSRLLAARIYDMIASELSEPIIVARTMANDSFMIEMLRNEKRLPESEAVRSFRDYLAGIRVGLDYEAAFVISEQTGRYYYYTGLNRLIDPEGEDPWYKSFVESGQEYAFDVDNDELIRDAWTIFVNARIEGSGGTLLGVCGVGIHMVRSQALFQSLEREYAVRISLIDPEGLILVDTDESRIRNERLEGLPLRQNGEYVYQRLGQGRSVVTRYVDKLGWYLVVESGGRGEAEELLNVLLINVVLCGAVLIIMVLAVRIIAMRTLALSEASFRDQATQLYNRRAFEEEKARLVLEPPTGDFVYVTADVNGLKTANDTLGHAAGDELIRGAADCLRAVFGRYGKVYRIGGDEFAVMLRVTPEKLETLQAELRRRVAAWKGERVGKLSISCGYAASREFPSETLAELSRISDERMYEAKAEHYRQAGIDRRRT